MKTSRIIGWIILLLAVPLWVLAVAGASAHGLFENQNSVQLMVLGGAVSMVGGIFLWYDD